MHDLPGVRLISSPRAAAPGAGDANTQDSFFRDSGFRSVLSHTHMMRGSLREPDSVSNLAAWTNRMGIDFAGVGSPWTSASAELYDRYEGRDRTLYYSGAIDTGALRRFDETTRLLDTLNGAPRITAREGGGGSTLFYLDNETPKARYGHLWWFGWNFDYPPWHDYDQPFDRWMLGMKGPDRFNDEPMPYERRPYLEILAAQRGAGALGIWAHPTSWWWSENGAFVTNIAAEMPVHLLAQGSIDGMVIMGYSARKLPYLRLWRHLIDKGYRIPGVAEADIGLSEPDLPDRIPLTWTPAVVDGGGRETPQSRGSREPRGKTSARGSDAPGSLAVLSESIRTGNAFCSTGPLVRLSVDGVGMGRPVETGPRRKHRIVIDAATEAGAGLGRVALEGAGGTVVWASDNCSAGRYELELTGTGERICLTAVVFGTGEPPDPARAHEVKSFAVSNPVYLEPPGFRPPSPATTEVTLRFHSHSAWNGGSFRFEDESGNVVANGSVRAGAQVEMVPASAKLLLRSPDGYERSEYLVNANAAVADWMRYLYRGRFLEDFPDTKPGDVPIAAFRFDRLADALARISMEL